ncbi:MAG: penicillin-binding protein 2 [Casimicrobiaceae bacterium]|nr:penicillin-binding protein 2 [Casimicrobiaceae bacterium]MCX8098807.1 penicillin-binding protein 2 [Casimicrobiaceae bacterium]MDW8311540.1 penicillin-binding protein 2 [Burkholderiales bacterium]
MILRDASARQSARGRPASSNEAWRVRLVLGGLVVGFLIAAGRSLWLQVVVHEDLTRRGEARTIRDVVSPAHRGRILSREGEVLALSLPTRGIYALPDEVEFKTPEKAQQLASALGMTVSELKQRLAVDRDFVFLARGLSPEKAQAIRALGIPGIGIQHEFRREYPSYEVTGQIVGATNIDDQGTEGIELAQNEWLSGKAGVRRVMIDRRGGVVEEFGLLRHPQPGRDLHLAIDSRVQHIAHRELRSAVERHRAKGGAIVVLDAETGEILAMVSAPTPKPGERSAGLGSGLRARALTDLFEPGSTMKAFTVATALELGVVGPNSLLPMTGGLYTLNGATIRDVHPIGQGGFASVSEILIKSSNVGTARIAEKISAEAMASFLHRSGFGRSPQTGFPGETHGRLRAPQSWRPIEKATMSYGYGLSVNLVQLARAYTVFANRGELVEVTLLKSSGTGRRTTVYSPETVARVLEMLERATQRGGTAPLAQVPGYRVAGKTGTAKKIVAGDYAEDRYVASFVGLAPVSNPRYVVAVMIDEPSAGAFYGGAVAAPVFSAVMGQLLRLFEVAPDAPLPRGGPVEPLVALGPEGAAR